jgi:hypothetical protein
MTVTINGSAGVTTNSGAVYDSLQRGTVSTATGGTSIDFLSTPNWARRITVILSGVSTNGTTTVRVQIGTSGTPTTSGYTSDCIQATSAGTVTITQLTNGFYVGTPTLANASFKGTLVLVNVTGNTWVCNGNVADSTNNRMYVSSGNVALGGVLDNIRLTINGTDTFDVNGGVNIIYE